MLKPEQCVLLRAVKTKPFEGKKSLGQPVPKASDGKQEWARFKSECVVLKKKGV